MHELKRVVVVGAGTMGSQIALQTAGQRRPHGLFPRARVAQLTEPDLQPGQAEQSLPGIPAYRQQHAAMLEHGSRAASLGAANKLGITKNNILFVSIGKA